MAMTASVMPVKPEAGLYVELPGEGRAKIISAKKQGQFYKLHVMLPDNRQLHRTYNPGSMTLSVD